MKRTQPDSNKLNHNPKWVPVNRPGVTEFIRAAENFVQAGKFVAALEQLTRAQQLQPNNKYITAVIERVENLRRTNPTSDPAPALGHQDSHFDSDRYLSITVGDHFDDGIKPAESQSGASTTGAFDLVQELTSIAQELANLGLPEPAFDTLMKAYLLDPMSPAVIACEERIVPLWNLSRTRNGAAQVNTTSAASSPFPSSPPENEKPLAQASAPESEEQRVELLKQQKEMERQEKEREVWREASSVPRIFKFNPWDDSQRAPSAEPDSSEALRRLFKKRRPKEQ